MEFNTEGRGCAKCGLFQPWSEFYRKSNGFNGRTSECRSCRRLYDETRREARKVYLREWRKTVDPLTQYLWGIERRYGITKDTYLALLDRQGGVCAVCDNTDPYRRLCIDHCHDTGKVRGLLCNSCNATIGYARNDPARLEACAAYLRR